MTCALLQRPEAFSISSRFEQNPPSLRSGGRESSIAPHNRAAEDYPVQTSRRVDIAELPKSRSIVAL